MFGKTARRHCETKGDACDKEGVQGDRCQHHRGRWGLALAATASAHVGVEVDGEAIAGQPARLVFSVPNERDDAATVSIEVQMPQDFDLTDVVADEVEGWTITTTTRDGDIVDIITWDATGPGLVGEESVELPVAVGPLPAVESLAFPTVQTYDDGEVVRWIEPAPAGEPEPEFPVPTLEITPASPDATTAPTATQPTATEPAATEPAAAPATEPATSETDAAVATTAVDGATPELPPSRRPPRSAHHRRRSRPMTTTIRPYGRGSWAGPSSSSS